MKNFIMILYPVSRYFRGLLWSYFRLGFRKLLTSV